MISLWQLRGLIRNDEELLNHYAQWIADLEPGEIVPARVAERYSQTLHRLHARRLCYLQSTLPAARASAQQDATSPSVTSSAAQPASL